MYQKGAAARLAQIATPASRLADQRVDLDPAREAAAGAARSPPSSRRRARRADAQGQRADRQPGTGKTTTLRALITVLGGRATRSCSPRRPDAAKRLSGRPASQRAPFTACWASARRSGFLHNDDNPLDADMIVVDEASMIDLVLCYSLLRAIPPDAHLLLVGDADQLPSVGAGNVLHDVIRGSVGKVTRLDVIFRQAETSHIITNAHRINRGESPDTSNRGDDFFVFVEEDPQKAADLLVEVVQKRIPARFGLDALADVQVLAPMYRGPLGVTALNDVLQETLNPNPSGRKAERRLAGRLFRVGDKVIQMRNNYEKDVFNGDIGQVHGFDMTNQVMTVRMDERLVRYDFAEADELTHAYCISVHRAQGSETVRGHARRHAALPDVAAQPALHRRDAPGSLSCWSARAAIAIAVRNDQVARRWSALDWRLRAAGR